MSSFELRTIDRNRLYTSIVDQIVEGIRSGAFPPARRCPPSAFWPIGSA